MKKSLFGIILLTLVMMLAACGGEDPKKVEKDDAKSEEVAEDTNKEEAKKDEAKEEPKDEFFKVGETAEFKDARYTIKSVTTTDERNEFEEIDPTAVIKIEYEVENLSDSDLSYGMDFSVYDGADNKMESYANTNDMGSIAPGKKAQAVEHYSIMELGEIEIHVAPIISFDNPAIYKVEIK